MRTAAATRKTKETDICITLSDAAGKGEFSAETGIGFFDHMLQALAVHAGLTLKGKISGDLFVDNHHTMEDVGIVLGGLLSEIARAKEGIARFGSAYIPMDESLAFCSLDFCNRPFLVYDCEIFESHVGGIEKQMFEEFFRALSNSAGLTLHLKVCYGNNGHHMIEALFKAFAHALKMALKVDSNQVLSTKGMI